MDDFEARHGASKDISVKRLTKLGNVGCLSLNQRIAHYSENLAHQLLVLSLESESL
jgi:hypothetical protein